MYLQYDRTKRSYGAYGVSPGKIMGSTDSDLLDYDFANADEVRKSIIERNIMEASQIREAEVHDLTANSPSYKKLRHEMDPNNMMNPFWDNNYIFVNDKPHCYHDGYTKHTFESHRRLKQMTKSPMKQQTKTLMVLGNDEDCNGLMEDGNHEGDYHGMAALIASVGDADEDPVEDAGKSPDEKRFRLLLHRRFILI